MQLAQLWIQNFRNLSSVELQPAAGINVIYGCNAAGKTSLLEAIHFLARVRSFRTTRPQQLIRQGSEAFTVRASLQEAEGRRTMVAVRRSVDRTEVRIDAQEVRSLSELAWHIPLQVVNSESQRLLLDGPQVRRSFIDWGVFHVEHDYYEHWRRYDRALRQRNRALRAGDERLAKSWEPELDHQATVVTELRKAFVDSVVTRARRMLDLWLQAEELSFEYRRGWAAGRSLLESFEAGRGREREAGYTMYGPHRADLLVRANGVDAQHRLSRGQQKLLTMALLLGSAEAVHAEHGAVLLLDDLPAELDDEHRRDVLDLVVASGAQTFITATDRDAVPITSAGAKWFHVEHGSYHEVV